MIEVEKKFKPTDEQLQTLLKDSKFLKEVVNHDVYYDYPDYRMFKKEIRLRKRNDRYELKIGDDEIAEIAEEIENDDQILKYLDITKPLEEFVHEDLVEIINFNTNRKKYKKGEFSIDIDELDFGYKCVEIELLVENESEVKVAQEKIIDLAKSYNFELKELPTKRGEYLRLRNPEMYKELYINK